MSIQIGVYDFFSYTIPGIIYLVSGIEFVKIVGIYNFKFDNVSSSPILIASGIIFLIVAFILGYLLDPIAQNTWQKLFLIPDFDERIEQRYPNDKFDISYKFNITYAYTIYASLKNKSVDLISEIEKFKAISIMFRNLSLAILLLAINQIIQVFLHNGQPINILLLIILMGLSIIAGRQSVTFNIWFFSAIHQAMIAEIVEPADLFPIKKRRIKKKK